MSQWERQRERAKILQSLERVKADQHPGLIWQAPENAARILCNVRIVDIDVESAEIVLIPDGTSFPKNFNPNSPFFLRATHRSLLMKSQGTIEGEALILKLPKELVLSELRQNPRLFYGVGSTHRASIRKVDRGIISQHSFNLPLYDIGPGGYSVTVSEQESNVFFPGDLVVVDKLGALTFSEPLRSTWKYLLHMDNLTSHKGRPFKMGLEFEREVPFALLQTLPFADW